MPGSPFPSGTLPAGVVVEPSGKFVYVANELFLSLSGYSINASTGTLTSLPKASFIIGPNSDPFAVVTATERQ